MKIDPRHLGAVRAVVEHGTFRKAADALGMSQPSLSKTIALLERSIGTKVFERDSRGSTLTEAGEIVLRGAVNMNAMLAATMETLVLHQQSQVQLLRIGATPSTMRGLVPTALARVAAAHPDLRAQVIEGLDDQLTERLQQGEIDLMVSAVGGLYPPLPDIIETPIAMDPYLVAMAPTHPLAGRDQVSLAELQNEAWVLPVPGSSHHRMVEALFMSAGLSWPTQCIGLSSLLAVDALLMGSNRVTIATQVEFVGRPAPLKAVPLSGGMSRTIGIKSRRNYILPPVAAPFADALSAIAATLLPRLP